jgi:hypothetical protein
MIASRVMKARRAACCVLCGTWYLYGDRIGLVDLGEGRTGWAHVRPCILKTQQPAA